MWPGSGPPRVPPSAARRRVGAARPDDDSGAVAILVALLTTVFVGLAALVVDHGMSADMQRRAQNAADAASLAAALVLSNGGAPTDAEAKAKDYALADFGVAPAEWKACTTSLPPGYAAITTTPCISQNATARRVRVVLPTRKFATIFAGIVGFSSQAVTEAAEATWAAPTAAGCVICILGKIDGQEGSIVAAGGDVYARDIDFNNNKNGSIEVTGGSVYYANSKTGGGTYVPDPPIQVAPFTDPYQTLPQPPIAAPIATTGVAGCTAGTYIDVSGCTSFGPGIYVLVPGAKKDPVVNAPANGVLFYLACADNASGVVTARPCKKGGEAGANFGGSGKNGVAVSALAQGTQWDGFAVWVDRNNTTGQRWTGGANISVQGILYSPNVAGLDDTNGNGLMTVSGQMIIGSLQMKGQGKLKYHVDVTGKGGPGGGTKPAVPRLSQ